jgi:hypothetical protein
MEPMIVLRGESKNTQRTTTAILIPILLVLVAQELGYGEVPTLDPDLGGFRNGREGHETGVRSRDESVWVVKRVNRTGAGLELSVEELVEGL